MFAASTEVGFSARREVPRIPRVIFTLNIYADLIDEAELRRVKHKGRSGT